MSQPMEISPPNKKTKSNTKPKNISKRRTIKSNPSSKTKYISNPLSKTKKNPQKTYLRTRILSQFPITDENFYNFKRYLKSPRDCVINALQIIGILDSQNANILRISCAGNNGFVKEQIEKIFIFITGNKYEFMKINNYELFSTKIKENLKIGHVVFAGYTGHVFLIGKKQSGEIVYIDAQQPSEQALCSLNGESFQKCEDLIKNKSEYYLLHYSPTKLTDKEIRNYGFMID